MRFPFTCTVHRLNHSRNAPLARSLIVATASHNSRLERATAACCGGEVAPWRRRRRNPPSPSSFCFSRSHSQLAPSSTDESDAVGHTGKHEGPTIWSEKEGNVSPLVRFRSAILQYPNPKYDSDNSSDYHYGLNDDCNGIDRDLILESQQSLETNQIDEQQILQRHWNEQQSTLDASDQLFDPFDMNIWPNLECESGGGGHVVLGRNASGKTLLSRSLVHSMGNIANNEHNALDTDNNPFLSMGDLSINRRHVSKNRNHHSLSHVSFDSHSDLLLNAHTTTVHRALIPSGGNRLSPTAKFLAVRLGMYPLLPRHINTLSTGEIRRVLLVRALVSKPELLVLDNAFDGLDVHGREGLQDIIERVLRGFRMDILVQGVGDAKDTARTQVLLLTHRPEEIADGMGRVTFMDGKGGGRLRTEDRMGREGVDLVRTLVSGEDAAREEVEHNRAERTIHPWHIASRSDFPSNADICNFWKGGSKNGTINTLHHGVLVHAQDLKVTRDGITLLSHLNWTLQRGERWHLAGTNGAGKSTLSRLLLRMSMNTNLELNSNANKNDAIVSDGKLAITPSMASKGRLNRGGVGWVSTELHLHAAHHWGDRTVIEILLSGASFLFNADRNHGLLPDEGIRLMDVDIATTAARWLGLLADSHSYTDITKHPFLSRKFSTLSQGEQKLLLLASAIAQRPSLLVLDEPCQGLDLWNRGHLLGLVEQFCLCSDMSLLYVTHHEEELIPSICHRLRLDDGRVTYCGEIT